ncbi:hypothetical protein [Subtercola sp. RTI3]|uniref:hypothetical protein n=1 Tax=Subtercola sp. RTI3 TaxID=3048639 RepID=UPI002B237955|nr:hypothetical protein [Subtercola sp. RTI3]MEA9984007.1 hypothetical protein [Subtercola sp. RTI3]
MTLIGTASRRQLWWFLLDANDVQLPVVFPIDDLPREPDLLHLDELGAHIAAILEVTGGKQLVAVWERPGRGRLEPADARWARALAHTCERNAVRLRAQLLSHTRGVYLLAPSDFASGQAHPTADSPSAATPFPTGGPPAHDRMEPLQQGRRRATARRPDSNSNDGRRMPPATPPAASNTAETEY